jgi:tetratricopeptide (TPR) repeat protein
MVRSGDDRWTAFVAAWVRDFLQLSGNGQAGGILPEQVRGAVAFLLERRHEPTQVLIREQLPGIHPAKFQDPLIRILLDQAQPLDLRAVHRAVDARIREGDITQEVLYAALILRDSAWTGKLLADYRQLRNSGRQEDQRSLQPVLACATAAQVDDIVSQWKQLTWAAQNELLVYLAAVDHRQWKSLAAEQLLNSPDTSETAINLLSQEASEEALALLRDLLRRQIAALEGTKDASARGRDQLQRLTAQIAGFVHPECRRLINQMCRDTNEYVRSTAKEQRTNILVRSPAVRSLQQESQLRDADQKQEADQMLEEVLRLDPFLPEAWLRRSSVRMHAGNFDAAMEDLRHAAELSPEHVEVESMISLVLVRQGKVAEGLQAADRLIASVPFDDYALYNGACSYARAAERAETSAADRTSWIARAVELIRATNATGFDDDEHLAQDVDLQILHDHPEWPALLEAAKNNPGRER